MRAKGQFNWGHSIPMLVFPGKTNERKKDYVKNMPPNSPALNPDTRSASASIYILFQKGRGVHISSAKHVFSSIPAAAASSDPCLDSS